MVALTIGSFLTVGAVQIYNQSRQAFVINESIARVQEAAHFAMDTLEADLRMSSNWGRTSRALSIEGRSLVDEINPMALAIPMPNCGDDWAFNLALPIDGTDNVYTLPCPASGGDRPDSDVITVRRASVDSTVPEAGRIQVHTNRVHGRLFDDGMVPASFLPITTHAITGELSSATHDLVVNSYYVSRTSTLVPGVPTLRRKTLTVRNGAPYIEDQEVAPGVENLQVQLGIDLNEDNTVDRYVNPGDDVYDPATPGYNPGARILTARVWLLVRALHPELGLRDEKPYAPGNADLGQINDGFRRLQISKTILLRNARI
jgi:type IV pilus assembly protein PilW